MKNIKTLRTYKNDKKRFISLFFIFKIYFKGHKIEQSTVINSLGKISNDIELTRISNDPFLRSMTYWYLKNYKQALNTLFEVDVDKNDSKESVKIISHVFNFYSFLRHHPLIIRQRQIKTHTKNDDTNTKSLLEDKVTPIERRLHFLTAYYHLINGCPLLALDVLSKLPNYAYSTTPNDSNDSNNSEEKPQENGKQPSFLFDLKTIF